MLKTSDVGLIAGWATAYGVYRARHMIRATLNSVGKGAETVQNSATRSADSRYISDLIEQCETTHLAGKYVKLSEIVVEPRFLPTPEFAVPPDNEVVRSVYRRRSQPARSSLFGSAVQRRNPVDRRTRRRRDRAGTARLPGSGRTTALLVDRAAQPRQTALRAAAGQSAGTA